MLVVVGVAACQVGSPGSSETSPAAHEARSAIGAYPSSLPAETGSTGGAAPETAAPPLVTEEALLNQLVESDPREAEAAFEVLLARLSELDRADTDPLLDSGEKLARLLGLTRAAWDGNFDALREITVLALEYPDTDGPFGQSLDVLFPNEENPRLETLDPKLRLAAIRRSLGEVRPLPSGGFTLP